MIWDDVEALDVLTLLLNSNWADNEGRRWPGASADMVWRPRVVGSIPRIHRAFFLGNCYLRSTELMGHF